MSEFKNFSVGVAVFVVRDGKLLLGKRKNGYEPGTWGTPGGRLHEGERMTVAAARELMEETGCTARSFDFFGAVNDDTVKTNHYIQFGFLANNLNAEPKNLEPEFCEGWQWFDLKALPNPIISSEIGLVRLFLENKHFSDTP